MGFVVFLRFSATKCLHVLNFAWPLFPLGYPLCASIRAVESGSTSETQRLVTYWILFSLLLLFEHAFAFLLKWVPGWWFIKLSAFSWLAFPNFDRAFYVYNLLVHPCLSFDPKIIPEHLRNMKKSYTSGNFLDSLERYVEENGSEALEKLIAHKIKCSGLPVDDQGEIKGEVTGSKEAASAESTKLDYAQMESGSEVTDDKEVATSKWLTWCGQTDVARKEIRAEVISKPVASDWFFIEGIFTMTRQLLFLKANIFHMEDVGLPANLNVEKLWQSQPGFAQMEIRKEVKDSKNAATADQILSSSHSDATIQEPKCSETGSNVIAMDLKEPNGTSAASGAPKKKVQKQWTCALCQIRVSSEKDLLSHLQGQKHKFMMWELKQPVSSPNMGASTSKAPNYCRDDTQSSPSSDGSLWKRAMKQEASLQDQEDNLKKEAGKSQLANWCSTCQKMLHTEVDMASHLKGRRHLAQARSQTASAAHAKQPVQRWIPMNPETRAKGGRPGKQPEE